MILPTSELKKIYTANPELLTVFRGPVRSHVDTPRVPATQ